MKTYEIVDGKEVEIDPGSGGSFEIRDGKRIRVDQRAQPHPQGDRPRDPQGRPLDQVGQPIADEKAEELEPAVTPAGRAPWEPEETDAKKTRRSRAGQPEGA